jgi:hypothetical protein
LALTDLLNRPPVLLRRALLADVAISGAFGVLLIVAAGPLSGLLEIPVSVLRWAGIILMPYVALVDYVGTRPNISSTGAWLVVDLNVVWVIASVLLLVVGYISPNALGSIFVIAQALVVGALGAFQFAGLRQMAAKAW